jgi:hypothetical protein
MPSDFSEYIPGTWSSHPEALKRQRLWLFLAGLAPMMVLGMLGFVAFTELDTWKSIVMNPERWIRVLATAFSISLGAIFTLMMLNMVSRTLGRTGGMHGRDELPFPVWIVGLGVFFWLAPMGLAFFRGRFFDPKYAGVVQFVLNLLCFAPFIFIMLWVLLARGAEELKDRTRRSKLLGILWIFFLGLALFSLLTDVHAALSHWTFSATWVHGIHRTMLRLILFATLFPLAVVCLALWQLIRLKPREGKDSKKADASAVLQKGELSGAPPAWLKELCAELPAGVRVEDGEPKLVSLPDTSAYHEGAGGGWLLLTGGKKPTEDQWKFLERFSASYRDALEKALENGDPQTVQTRADILLQGMPGSGRTEALCTAALYAALVRGQRVLFVVSDNQQSKILRDRLDGRLRGMFVDCYVWCDVLTKPLADGWLEENPVKPVADILFATPETIERCFFANNTTIEPTKLKRLREAVLSFEVVLVDDFMEFGVTERSHLAFILDKLRLLLISERLVPQFVVAMPRLLAPEGVEHLGERLFGLRNFDRNNNVRLLRPRPCAPFWELNLRVADSESEDRATRMKNVCRRLVARCREELNLNVLFFQKGIGENARKDLEHDLGGQNGGGRLRVISKLDDADDGHEPPDAVFYLSIVAGNVSVALRLATGDGKSVYVRIAAEGELDIAGDMEKAVLIPDESAVSLRMAHLRSVLAFLDPLTPVDATVWSHFGISLTHPQIREEPASSIGQPSVLISWLHDEWLEEDRYPVGHLWPYLVLEHATTANVRGQPVNFRVLPQSREAVFKAKDGLRLFLGRLSEEASMAVSRQLAVWKDKRGNRDTLELEMDLAHAADLILKTDDDVYSAAALEAPGKAEEARFAISITAQFNRGDGSDFEIPVRSFSWQARPSFRAEDVWQLGSMAGFTLTHRNGEFCHVEGSLDASLNLLGEARTNTPRSYAYPAHLSGILLAPILPEGADGSPSIRACLNGRWQTRSQRGFSPALTHAVTAALRHRLDGWSFFALAPVFLIAGRQGSVGQAVIWLLEPVNSGRTVYPMLKALLQKSDFRKTFLQDVRRNLNFGSTLPLMRQSSRLAFTAETFDADDCAQALQLLDCLESGTPNVPARQIHGEDPDKHEPSSEPKRLYSEQYTEEEREFDQVIVAGLLAFQDSIDVTKFAGQRRWSSDKIWDTMQDVLWNNPQLFYVSKYGIKWQMWRDTTGQISRFLLLDFQYGIERREYAEKKAELDREATTAMNLIESAVDPVEKARLLHDHIVRICMYDHQAAENDDHSSLARTAYSALVRHKAVCEGYTMGYRYLLNLAGIQSEELLGMADVPEPTPHAWNYLKIGNDWYHVDVTWDDPVYTGRQPDKEFIAHDYFLLSDDALHAKSHHDWNLRGLPPAINTQHEGRIWPRVSGRGQTG